MRHRRRQKFRAAAERSPAVGSRNAIRWGCPSAIPVTRPLTLTAGDGPLIASSMSNSAESAGAIFSGLRSRSVPPYTIDLSVYPAGRPNGAPTRYSPGGSSTRKVPSIWGRIVSDAPGISGRVKEEGAGASPSTERRPVTSRGTRFHSCSWRSRLQQQKNGKQH